MDIRSLLHFLETIGVLTYATHDGWCYPISESAQTVVDAFENALHQAGVELVLNTKVQSVRKNQNKFILQINSNSSMNCERLIIAAGGKAYPTLGSRGELFNSLKNLGHSILPLSPALAPVTCEMEPYLKLIGVRLDVHASLYEKHTLLAETCGNLIFTRWGLNGPAVMDLSHLISTRPEASLELHLNLLHTFEPALRNLIHNRRNTSTPLRVLIGSVLPPKLPPVLLALAGISPDALINELKDTQMDKLFRLLTALPFKVTGVRGFEFCQISTGGVPVDEVDPLTMHSTNNSQPGFSR